MFMHGFLTLDVARVDIAHEYTLDAERVCEYPTGRGNFGLVYVLGGEAEYRFFSGERVLLDKENILFLFPHAAYKIVTHGNFHHHTVNFTVHTPPDDEREYILIPSFDRYRDAELFARLSDTWQKRSFAFELLAKGLLYELLYHLSASLYSSRSEVGVSGRLARAKAYIDENPATAVDIATLAREADMSETTFRREWKRTFGETSMQYRDRVRLAVAKEYLMSGYYNVTEVSLLLGFSDVSYFVRFFRKHTGIPPRAYIKKT